MIDYKILGKNIKNCRKKLGYTQEKLSEFLECGSNHISNIENGRTSLSLEMLMKLCKILNTTPNYLLLGTENTNEKVIELTERIKLLGDDDVKLCIDIINLFINK